MESGNFFLQSALAVALFITATHLHAGDYDLVGRNSVGQAVTPVNRVLNPAGTQIELPKMRPQVLAHSPDGRLLVTSGLHELVVIDPVKKTIIQRLPLPRAAKNEATETISTEILKPDNEAKASYTGLKFSPDGTRLFLSDVNGNIKIFSVDKEHQVAGKGSFPLPAVQGLRRSEEIPAGIAVSRDGKKLYVAGNLSNRLLELDAQTGNILRQFDVGSLPYDVVLIGNKAYVSNWGGRRPDTQSVIGPAGRGTTIRVDSVRYIANEGSVSVVDLSTGK